MGTVRMLALATNPVEGASFRYRILAYVPHLEGAGFAVETSSFFPSDSLGVVYSSRRVVGKAYYVLRGAIQRRALLRRDRYDVIVVHRELFPLGLRVFLRRLRSLGVPIIYDFDDAMFLPQRTERPLLGKIEDPNGAREIIGVSRAVVAGNGYLAEYARQYNPNVVTIPTPIDTERFRPRKTDRPDGEPLTIGWIGSHTTVKYLASLAGPLTALARGHAFQFKAVGAPVTLPLNGVRVRQQGWTLKDEVAEFQGCDVGVYPLDDDAWARGKCGFKAIQFMAVGVPVVASSVGMNAEIIQDGVNGFLASSEGEWAEKLSLLLKDRNLRRAIGMAGRRTVEERYSLAVNGPKFVDVIRGVIA